MIDVDITLPTSALKALFAEVSERMGINLKAGEGQPVEHSTFFGVHTMASLTDPEARSMYAHFIAQALKKKLPGTSGSAQLGLPTVQYRATDGWGLLFTVRTWPEAE